MSGSDFDDPSDVGYTWFMDIVIDIPDHLFNSAEELAGKLGVSRGELYADALVTYLKQKKSEEITARINAVCEQVDTRMDPALMAAQMAILPKDRW